MKDHYDVCTAHDKCKNSNVSKCVLSVHIST
jgi:hypothetical protein